MNVTAATLQSEISTRTESRRSTSLPPARNSRLLAGRRFRRYWHVHLSSRQAASMAAMLPFIVMIAPKARSPHHVAVRVPSKPDAVAGASRLATICRTGNSRYPHGFRPIRSRAVPEAYGMKDVDDFIFLLIRTPAFSEKVNDIAVECGN